jgi:hypothetical protein
MDFTLGGTLACCACRELVFEADGTVSGLISLEGEKISFAEHVNPAATGAPCCCSLAAWHRTCNCCLASVPSAVVSDRQGSTHVCEQQ